MNSYFQSYVDYFWQWEDGNEVLAIPQGNTIAYRALVVEILEKLAPQGLPPFGALLLALIATNPSGSEDIDTIHLYVKKTMEKAFINNKGHEEILEDAIRFLNILTKLPKDYKSQNKRIQVFQTLFEKCHNIQSIKFSKSIVNSYKNTTQLSLQSALKEAYNHRVFKEDFRTIALLKKRFPTEHSIMEQMARLPDLPPESLLLEETANNPEPKYSDFVQELIEEPKTFQIGSLIRHIWSGLHIPFHNTLPSQQPMGGVSDISNKGDFTRLLVSEFANDDDLLLLRLANQEALYLNREIPPSSMQMERILLIDVSLLNWGTPKCIAFALMLAIAKHPKTDIKCRAFAVGNRYTELKFNTIHELIEALQIVEPSLHPALGIASFCKNEPPTALKELFLISTEETMALPAMHKLLSDLQNPFNYQIYTDQLGHIEVYKKQNLGKKQVQSIQLPLKSLWRKEPKESKITKITKSDVYTHSTFPLLVCPDVNAKRMLYANDGTIFQIARDRNLLKYKNKDKGWELVYEHLPFLSGSFAIGLTRTDEYLLLMYNVQTRNLSVLNLFTGASQTVLFKSVKGFGAERFMFHDNFFYYLMPSYQDKYLKVEMKESLKVSYDTAGYQELKKQSVAYEEMIKEHPLHPSLFGALLKNIDQIFINHHNKLVINTHELHIEPHGKIEFILTTATQVKHMGVKNNEGMYIFPNGSSITLHRSGILILRNKTSSHTYEVILKNIGQKPATLLQNISRSMDLSKPDAEKLMKPQTVLLSGLSRTNADTYIKELKKDADYDCEIIVKASENDAIYIPSLLRSALGVATHDEFAGNEYFLREELGLNTVDPKTFWTKHIESFIQKIITYAATT